MVAGVRLERVAWKVDGCVSRKMDLENAGWGAPRIHSELLKLGFSVDERTVSRYIPKRPPDPGSLQRWIWPLRTAYISHAVQ